MSVTTSDTRRRATPVDLAPTTPNLAKMHRSAIGAELRDAFDGFDASAWPDDEVRRARRQWASRADAEFASTAQFAGLVHALTRLGAPIELIGAATRLVTDECRHADLCQRFAAALGDDTPVGAGRHALSVVPTEAPTWFAVARAILTACALGEQISVTVLDALRAVCDAPLAAAVCERIGSDERFHARFGYEALAWILPRLTDDERQRLERGLPSLLGHFEQTCSGGPDVLARIVEQDVTFERRAGNLGTLARDEYAALFYASLEADVLPGLTALGFDAPQAWAARHDAR